MQVLHYALPGYPQHIKTCKIEYHIPDGFQGPGHPNPGKPYHGTTRTAYLPCTEKGAEVERVWFV